MKDVDTAPWESCTPELIKLLAEKAPHLPSLSLQYPPAALPIPTSALPAHLGQLCQLTSLHLDFGRTAVTTEQVDAMLQTLPALQRLELKCSLSSRALEGGFPRSIASCCPELRHLAIRDAALIGPVPPELGGLTRLTRLALENGPAASLPDSISQLTALQELSLTTRLTAALDPQTPSLPMGLSAYRRLSKLEMGDDAGSPVLGELTSLRFLSVRTTKFQAHWTALAGLADLVLTCRTAAIPAGLVGMTNLRKLRVAMPLARPANLPRGPYLSRVQSLRMELCSSTAGMPAFLSDATELQELDFSNANKGIELTTDDRAVLVQLPMLRTLVLSTSIQREWKNSIKKLKADCFAQGHELSVLAPLLSPSVADGGYFI